MTAARSNRRLLLVFGVLVCLSAGGAAAFAIVRHARESNEAQRRNEEVDRGPILYVTKAEVTAGERQVTLPGEVRPFQQAQIYARTNGYLRSLNVFPGDAVKRNQLLGIIESPETDQQVTAAEADLGIRTRNAQRARQLGPEGVVPEQQVDQAESDEKTAHANLARLRAVQGYQQLRAPFDGVVTQRFLDPGALVQAQVQVVEVTDATKVKVTVYVGQDVAPFVKPGDGAEIRQQERPELRVQGKVTRISDSLDSRSRTMLTEIWLDNRETKLQPGTFVRVTLKVPAPHLPTVPNEALFVRGHDVLMAVVKDGVVQFRVVEPGLNDGRRLQIRTGITGEDLVALNVPSELEDGARVRVKTVPGVKPAGGASAHPAEGSNARFNR